MRSRSTLVSEIQQLLTGERADPRPAQGVFLIPVALELVLRLFTGVGLDEYFVYGSIIAAIPTLGAFAIGTGRLSHRWTILLPILDMVAIGVYRQSPGTAIGVAVVFPAIWLGLQFGRKGVAITTVMMALVYVGPTLPAVRPHPGGRLPDLADDDDGDHLLGRRRADRGDVEVAGSGGHGAPPPGSSWRWPT